MKHGLNEHRRLFEVIPGALVWLTFIGALTLSFTQPLIAIYLIILFDLYWLFRVVYFVIFVIIAWHTYQRATRVDWFVRLKRDVPRFRDYIHCIFLPTVGESFAIIDATLQALLKSAYPADRMIVVLASEERAGREHNENIRRTIEEKYAHAFFRLMITVHPDGIVGEIKGKGANINYAGRQAKQLIDELGIPYEKAIVSAFDIDTIAHPHYFACLTHTYAHQEQPTRASYQPVVLYNNNMWDSPAPMRLAALSTTYWLLTELVRPDRLFTFSSHSMSFQALVDVGFWDKTIVSEDSRIFLQCYLHYRGDYRVVPLYIPVSMDTVLAPTLRGSLVNLYKQQRRWAWGVEHFPYLISAFIKDREMPLPRKLYRLWLQTEGMYTWATAPIIILILGWLPLLGAGESVKTTVLAQNAPHILAWLMNFSMIGIFVLGLLSFSLLPSRPERHDPSKYLFMVLQWALLPFSIIVFSALPAIDAQTRLMFGKYLGFYVTEKARKDMIT